MRVLCLGSCRVLPSYFIYNAGYHYHPNNQSKTYNSEIDYWCRPYGQTISTRDTLEIIKSNLISPDFESDRYVNADQKKKINQNLKIKEDPTYPKFNNFDGFIIEISSKKYVEKYYYSGLDRKSVHQTLTIEEIMTDLTEINEILGKKPILIFSHISMGIPDRLELNYCLSKWCRENPNVTYLDMTVIALERGMSLTDIYIPSEVSNLELSYSKTVTFTQTRPTHYTRYFDDIKTVHFNEWCLSHTNGC